MDKQPIQRFMLEDVPEFHRFQDANFQDPSIDALQTAIMYGRAIQWISMLDVIWPDFESENYYFVDTAYIVANDPDKDALPQAFYEYIAKMIAMFWELQLRDKYPNGQWSVNIDDEPEMTVRAEIITRG